MDSAETAPESTENSAPSETNLEALISTLTADQWQALLDSAPEEVVRTKASLQNTTLGRFVQSEADRRMESWRLGELKRRQAEGAKAEEQRRRQWLESAEPDEIATRVREDARLADVRSQVQMDNFVQMFTELRPDIEALPPERRARIEAFIQSPDSDRVWYKLPRLLQDEQRAHERGLTEKAETDKRATAEARTTATAIRNAPATDVGRGAVAPSGTSVNDRLREFGAGGGDIHDAAQALADMGIKVPRHLLKKK